MRVEPAPAFAALALHGMAHVPLARPASLFDPRYVAWCASALPREAREPLASDGPALGAEAMRGGADLAMQWLPRLHRDIAAFVRVARRDLAELTPADVDDARALLALTAPAPTAIEWLRADLALAAAAFAAWLPMAEAALGAACDDVRSALALVPAAQRPARVHLVWALGPRGRGFEDGVLVGAPAPWNDVDAPLAAVLALHEHAVVRAHGGYAEREWSALRSVARLLVGSPLAGAHARWLGGLDLSGLETVIPASLWSSLHAAPQTRARALAGLSP